MRHAWLVRPFPHKQIRINEFRSKNIVAVGWPGIGNLSGKTREDLKVILSGKPYQLTGLGLGNAYATIDIFVNQMKVGDVVLVPNGDDIFFCEITSEYFLDQGTDNTDDGYPHQRNVTWLSKTSRQCLTKALRSSLKVHRTTANLSHHLEEILCLSEGLPYHPQTDLSLKTIELTYPLRPDFTVVLNIPTDITRDESERLSTYFRTLYFKD